MGSEIVFKDLITLFRNPDRIRIVKGGRDLFVGFMGQMEEEDRKKYADEVVKRIKGAPEITHKHWKEKRIEVAASAGSGGRLQLQRLADDTLSCD